MAPPIVRLHPKIGDVYQGKVAELVDTLNDKSVKEEASEILRALIDRVVLSPRPEGKELKAELFGDLANIIALTNVTGGKNKLPGSVELGSQVSVVAAARNRRYLHLDFASL